MRGLNIKITRSFLNYTALALGLAINIAMIFHPTIKKKLSHFKDKSYRKVTGVLTGTVAPNISVKVVKIQTNKGLFLEFYSIKDNVSLQLLSRVKLPYSHDGYYHFSKTPSKIAMIDLNNDGQKEVISTSFDSSLNGHLSFYSYNMDNKTFTPMSQ